MKKNRGRRSVVVCTYRENILVKKPMSVRLRLEIVSEKKPDTHAEELALIRLRHEVCVHLLRWKMNQLKRVVVD